MSTLETTELVPDPFNGATTLEDPEDTTLEDPEDTTLETTEELVPEDDFKIEGEGFSFTFNDDERDEETGSLGVDLDIDLSEFEVFEAATAELVEGENDDDNNDLVLYGPNPDAQPKDDFMIEARAEEIDIVSLKDFIRTGELDHLLSGGGISDVVAGDEEAMIEGKLYDQNSGDLTRTAKVHETVIHGKMDVSASFEDSVLLGGTLTETWEGPSMVVAGMSDDLMAGIGARGTLGIDLWLNLLNAMDERPASAAADGMLVETAATHFEREAGTSVYAVGNIAWTGTTITTTRSGFRQLVRTAVGARNLIPGAGAGGSETAPPSPPAAPSMASGLLLAGIAGMGAVMTRGIFRIGMTANRIADAARLGDSAADAARLVQAAADSLTMGEDVTLLRHSADAATQLEELKAADNAKIATDLKSQAGEFIARAKELEETDPEKAQALRKAAESLIDAEVDVRAGRDPRKALIRQSEILENLGLADESQKLRMHALAYEDMVNNVKHIDTDLKENLKELRQSWSGDAKGLRADATSDLALSNPEKHQAMTDAATSLDNAANKVKNGEDPRPGLLAKANELDEAGEAEIAARLRRAADQYGQTVQNAIGRPVTTQSALIDETLQPYASVESPYAAADETVDPGTVNANVPPQDIPELPPEGVQNVTDKAVRDVSEWQAKTWQYRSLVTDELATPRERDLAHEMFTRYAEARAAVDEGRDPRPGLRSAADRLETHGHHAEAKKLRDAAQDFTKNLDKYIEANGGKLPRGVLDYDTRQIEKLQGSTAQGIEEVSYSTVGEAGTGHTVTNTGESTSVSGSYNDWLADEQTQIDRGVGNAQDRREASRLPEGFDQQQALDAIDAKIDALETEFVGEMSSNFDGTIRMAEKSLHKNQVLLAEATSAEDIKKYTALVEVDEGKIEIYQVGKQAGENGENISEAMRSHFAQYNMAAGAEGTNARSQGMLTGWREAEKWMAVDELNYQRHSAQVDMLMVAWAEIEAGSDPSLALDSIMKTLPADVPQSGRTPAKISETRAGAETGLEFINAQFESTWGAADMHRLELDQIKMAGTGGFWKGLVPPDITPRGISAENIQIAGDEIASVIARQDEFEEVATAGRVVQNVEPPTSFPHDPDFMDVRAGVQLEGNELIALSDEIVPLGRTNEISPPTLSRIETPVPDNDIVHGQGTQWPDPQTIEGSDTQSLGRHTEGEYKEVTINNGNFDPDYDHVLRGSETPNSQAVVNAIPDVQLQPDGSYTQGKKKTRTANRWKTWLKTTDAADPNDEAARGLQEALANAGEQEWLDDMMQKTADTPSWLSSRQHMRDELTQLRRDSNWRGTIAYGDAFSEMREELAGQLVELAGYNNEVAQQVPDARRAYEALSKAADEAAQAGDWEKFKKITTFLSDFDVRTQARMNDLSEDVRIADTVYGIRGTNKLNDQMDAKQLAEGLQEKIDDAEANLHRITNDMRNGNATQEQVQHAGQELAYWNTCKHLVETGQDPLVESSNSVAYLRATNQHANADIYIGLQPSLETMMSNPDYHKPVDAFTFPTGASLRPDLANASGPSFVASYDEAALIEMDMRQFVTPRTGEAAEAAEAGDSAAAIGRRALDYEEATALIVREAGDADFLKAPMTKSKWEGDEIQGIMKIAPQEEPIPGIQGKMRDPEKMGRDLNIHNATARYRENKPLGVSMCGKHPDGVRTEPLPTRKSAVKVSFGDVTVNILDPNEAPEMLSTRRYRIDSQLGAFTPTRQIGTRRASNAGDFPFSMRDKIVNTLMQGKSSDPDDVASLHNDIDNMVRSASFRDGNYASEASPREWRKMRMAARDLRVSHPHMSMDAAYQSHLDSKTLGKLLDLLDSPL